MMNGFGDADEIEDIRAALVKAPRRGGAVFRRGPHRGRSDRRPCRRHRLGIRVRSTSWSIARASRSLRPSTNSPLDGWGRHNRDPPLRDIPYHASRAAPHEGAALGAGSSTWGSAPRTGGIPLQGRLTWRAKHGVGRVHQGDGSRGRSLGDHLQCDLSGFRQDTHVRPAGRRSGGPGRARRRGIRPGASGYPTCVAAHHLGRGGRRPPRSSSVRTGGGRSAGTTISVDAGWTAI